MEVAHGSLSLSGAASAASRKLALAGAPHTLNAQLGHLFYHRSDAHDFDTLTVVVTGDNGESLAKAMTIVIAKASSEVKEFRFAGDANSVRLTLGEGVPAVAGCADLFADLSKLMCGPSRAASTCRTRRGSSGSWRGWRPPAAGSWS